MALAILLGTLLAVLGFAQAAAQQLPPAASLTVDFTTHVEPILKGRCFACHGEQLQLRKLRLDQRADAIRGGESGVPAIVPGDSANSLLIRYVAGIDPDVVMPPEGDKLAPHEVGRAAGVDRSGGCVSGCTPRGADRRSHLRPASDHWAFQPVRRPKVPPDS